MSSIEPSNLSRRLSSGPLKEPIIERLREGETPQAIATWLQTDLLEYVNDSPGELAAAIQVLFLTEVPLEDRLDLIKVGRSAMSRTIAKQKTDESSLELMTKLAHLQMGRIEIGHEAEETLGLLSGTVSNEIEVARRLIKDKHEMERVLGTTGSRSTPSNGIPDDVKLRLGRAFMRMVEREAQLENTETVEVEVIEKND